MKLAVKPGLAPGFLLAALLCACGADRPAAPPPAAAPPPIVRPARSYVEELGWLDRALAQSRKLMGESDDPLLALEPVSLLMERARLTGDYDDYAAASAALTQAKARAGELLYPCIPAAHLHYSLHRLAQASEELQHCPGPTDATEIGLLRADIDFQSGRYREAEDAYRAAVNRRGLPGDYIRLALYRAKTGAPGEAAALLEAAEQRNHGESATAHAWLKLQRGLIALEQNRKDEALALYLHAAEALPGWWLVDEHIAEVKALMGKREEAMALYRDVIVRTGHPEFMDALAVLEQQAGRADEASRLIARARAEYERRLALFPEAAGGHALDHFLKFGSAEEALRLARANYELRPNGDSALSLAQALDRSGRAREALALLERQARAGWDTTALQREIAHLNEIAVSRAPVAAETRRQ